MSYYRASEVITTALLSRFYDGRESGFFDTPSDAMDKTGALRTRRKPLQDAPTPAGNPNAAALLLRLHALSDNPNYLETAQETLEAFAGIVEHLGLYAATFGLALGRLARPSVQVVIVGEGPAATQMEIAALARFAVNKTVIRLRRDQLGALPPALAVTLPHLPGSEAVTLVCSGTTCAAPVTDAAVLMATLQAADAG